jgi:hypothetical protein
MADDNIDYLECLDYGDHFIKEVDELNGKSKLVDVGELKTYVASTVADVAIELEKQGIKRSGVRIDRKDVAAKTGALRKQLEKFHNHLGSLDDDQGYDIDAFFKGGNLGTISALKPADLGLYAGEVIRGFAADANKNLPDASKWKTRLEDAKSALGSAIADKSTSSGITIQGTVALVAARQAFLVAYNGVAKRLVQGILIQLDRKDELKLFFKDLQVNEDSTPVPAPAQAPKDATPVKPGG